jgi:hypothetical protein
MPLVDTPQKTLWPPFTRAGELDEVEAFQRLYSSILCARRRWNGENLVLQVMWFYLFLSHLIDGRDWIFMSSGERRREGAGKPGVRKEKDKASGEIPVIKPTQFPIK